MAIKLKESLLKYNELAFSYPADPPYELNSVIEQLRAKQYTPRLEQFVATTGHVVYCGIWVREPEQPATLAGDPPTAEELAEAFKNTFPGISLSEWAKNKDKDTEDEHE